MKDKDDTDFEYICDTYYILPEVEEFEGELMHFVVLGDVV